MTPALTGSFPSVPCTDLAYLTDEAVSSDSCAGSSQALSDGLTVLNGGSPSGSETSLVESLHSRCMEFIIHTEEQNPYLQHRVDTPEGHIAVDLLESHYRCNVPFDDSTSLELDRSHFSAEDCIIKVDDVKSPIEVSLMTCKGSKSSAVKIAVAEDVEEKECVMVKTCTEELDVHGGPNSSAGGICDPEMAASLDYVLHHDADAATVVSHIPGVSISTAVGCNENQLSDAESNNTNKLFDRVHGAVVRMPSGSSEYKQSCTTDREKKSPDCSWDGNPSDVGDDGKVHDCGAGKVSRIIPVTSVKHLNTSGNASVVMSSGSHAEISDRDPSEDDQESCQSTALSTSGEDLLVLVNFRITADRYEGSSMASETRESVARMIVRQSDVLPKMSHSCSTLSDWTNLCSTENRQFYLVRKKKTNVELSGDSLTMTSADDGRLSDFCQTSWYHRDASDMRAGGMGRVAADQSVIKTTRVMKHVVVTKTETTTSIDDEAEHRPQNVYTETRDTSSVDKEDDRHETTWRMDVMRRSRLEARDSADSGATDVGESGTTDYVSLSETYEREDIGDSFSSDLEEVETVTDADSLAVDTEHMVSDDNDTETTGISASDLSRAALEVRVSDVREITQHEICVEFSDDDENERSAAVKIVESDEAKIYLPDSVELQETEMGDVTEMEPVGIISVHPVSLESACEKTDVKLHKVENHVQIIRADDEGMKEDGRPDNIQEIDTFVIRPDIVVGEFAAPDRVFVTKSICIIKDKDAQIPVTVDDETRDALDADSGMSEHVELSKSIILAEIKETGDVMLEKVSHLEETGVESLSLLDHESDLYDTVLECPGIVHPITHCGIICDETYVTVSDCAAALESVSALNLDKPEVCAPSVYNVAEASNAVFVNTVMFQTEREIVVRTMEDPMVNDVLSVKTGMTVIDESDDGHDADMLEAVKTCDIRTMCDASTETAEVNRICLAHETKSTACQTTYHLASDLQQLQQTASTISVALQAACLHADATTSTAELVDEGRKLSLDRQLSNEHDILLTTQTDKDVGSTVTTFNRMNLLSTAVQTDPIDSISSSTVEIQTGSREASSEPCGTVNQVVSADVHALATVDVAEVETQTLPCYDITLVTEAQTSTTPVDLVSIHTQTIEHRGGKLIAEAETCTTPVEVTVTETQTSLNKDDVLTAEAQTLTDPVDLESTETRQVEYEVTVDDGTFTMHVDMASVETQTSVDIISAAEAQTSVTPVDLVMAETQTVEADGDTHDYLSHLWMHSIETSEIDHVHVYDSVQPDNENYSGTSTFFSIILQTTDELEVSDSSSDSIYLEDYLSSTETLFTDAEEDFEGVVVPDSSLKMDSDEDDVDAVLEDMHSESSEYEDADTSRGNIYVEERNSGLQQSIDDDTGHNVVSQVETLRDIPTSPPACPDRVHMKWRPVSPDAVSTPSQVCSVASGCGDSIHIHASLLTCLCILCAVLWHARDYVISFLACLLSNKKDCCIVLHFLYSF